MALPDGTSGARPPSAYVAQTGDIAVRVKPSYLAGQSEPGHGRYVWAYTVEIENRGQTTWRLVSRHWIITDALNRIEEVRGDGVVGEQPVLKPGEAFRYTSSCALAASSGAMRGSYRMVGDDGAEFEAEIPEFSLHLPEAARSLN